MSICSGYDSLNRKVVGAYVMFMCGSAGDKVLLSQFIPPDQVNGSVAIGICDSSSWQ